MVFVRPRRMRMLVVEGAVNVLVKMDLIGTTGEDQYSRELNMEPTGVNFQGEVLTGVQSKKEPLIFIYFPLISQP